MNRVKMVDNVRTVSTRTRVHVSQVTRASTVKQVSHFVYGEFLRVSSLVFMLPISDLSQLCLEIIYSVHSLMVPFKLFAIQ